MTQKWLTLLHFGRRIASNHQQDQRHLHWSGFVTAAIHHCVPQQCQCQSHGLPPTGQCHLYQALPAHTLLHHCLIYVWCMQLVEEVVDSASMFSTACHLLVRRVAHTKCEVVQTCDQRVWCVWTHIYLLANLLFPARCVNDPVFCLQACLDS